MTNAYGDLLADDGSVLVPAEKRQKCEVYSRVVGYMRPVGQWNKGKQEEWSDRRNFVVANFEVKHGTA